ncbi:lysosomal acid phosphatase-like isoform X1 [Metopolophium dirhodum]|uniref:lysosomal acid phosphatase-like isoform X1 n=2 Tax=Metopolophium dirhodum TaxID=44670 RepID=UPI0029901A21|nr:lysosomal acid phosphatase-like isoform X1 [Metopolophium dirhodum]
MALNFKKVTFIVGLSLTVIVICSVLYVFTVGWEQQNNDVVGPGRFSDPSLKFVTVLFRHGNRAPMLKYKTDPHKYAFPEGKMELTKKGKHNMYKKGQLFRRLYNGFLSDLYLDSEILIKTTNTSRTFMSAAMVLAGMYPPKNYQKWSNSETVWQPIPIYSNSPDLANLFGKMEICPSIDSFVANLPQIIGYSDKNITALISFLSENCGQPMTGKNVFLLYDLFLCQIADGLSVPEWIKPYHLATMESISSKISKSIFENTSLLKLLAGPLLNEIGLNMESSSNNYNTTRKMYLYSGHDISIGMAMSFLGHTIEWPGFGASLHFHMYYDVTKGYTVKVFYFDRWDNEKGEEILIPICGNPCKFEDFKKLLTNNFSGSWEDECQKI